MTNNFEEKARDLVLHQIDQINVEKLSQQLYLDPSQVYRKIKKATGTSTAIFIRKIRLERAIELLVGTDMPIKQISYHVGFGEISYFHRCFKESYGITPRDYRISMSLYD
ncbi:MAG: helix-turn-helix transcriptional regulator [Saprospiraceae bacterium]